jgi:hypothetical protein
MGGARLTRDDERGVLWLATRRQVLAVSDEGVRMRAGRRRRQLEWSEVEQVQLARVWRHRACVEVFIVGGGAYSVGPFPAALAERWVRGCADVARRRQLIATPVVDGVGFGLA